jgi:nicotinate phosphoribosyltransferase
VSGYGGAAPALLTDLYELTMMQGYFFYRPRLEAVFDMFYRRQPFGGGYCVFAGLDTLLKTLAALRFSAADLKYLAGLGLFKPRFLDFLADFRFRGDVYAAEEGSVVFPGEPLLRVHGRVMETQLVESVLLNTINFQTLVATKAARAAQASGGRAIIEFGLRRAQGPDGALSASRAAYIGGASATSNVLAGRLYGIPVRGTMAHSWVQAFGSEEESFREYARLYPGSAYLLVDTYDTLRSGLPAAIRTLRALKKAGKTNFGVRLDSGDLENLSRRARQALDKAGLEEAKIVVSNELDERVIEHLAARGAPVDYFGVGTSLAAAQGDPALTGVYKLAATRAGRGYAPSLKVSEDPGKVSNPHVKNVLRLYGPDGLMAGDLVCLESELPALQKELARGRAPAFYRPDYPVRQPGPAVAVGRALLRPVMRGGEIVYSFPGMDACRGLAARELASLPAESRRLLNPHIYQVGLSRGLAALKLRLAQRRRGTAPRARVAAGLQR